MREKQAEKLWKEKSFQNMKANMAASQYTIEKRFVNGEWDYCVSHWVSRNKVAEYWPRWTQDFQATHPF